MSAESKTFGGKTSPTLMQVCLDMKAMPGNIAVLSENKDNYASIKDGLRPVKKSNKTRNNPASHRKTRINSASKQVLMVKPGPDVPPPYDMTKDCIVPNHFLPPAKICADDDDQDISSDAFEEQHMNSKACALCNRGLETRMMQGSLTRYDPTAGFNPFQLYYEQLPRDKPPDMLEEPTLTVRRGPGRPPFKGRKKSTVVNGFSVVSSNPNLPLDMILFGTSHERDIDELFEATGHTWCHTCCALWSEFVEQDETNVKNVAQAVFHAMTQKCEHCNNFGASVSCNDKNCTKKFHYTCASSAGCFQEVKSKMVLCPEHIHKAEELVGDDAKCAVCDEVGDLTKQLFCCNCWRHFHGKCLQPEVDILPCARMAWHCPACKICSDCGSSVDDNKMLVCDICDKGYHFYCLKPPVASAPKDGWKCENCRRCYDCGSNTPGSGATSRWHFNYTVCDSCYQQRNKGLSCPQCRRAYRHFSDIPMVQCKKCEKSVHKECDEAFADMVPYMCTNCRGLYKHEPTINNIEENPAVIPSNNQLPGSEDMLSSMTDSSLSLDMNINMNIDCGELDDSYDLGEKLPFDEEMEVELKDDEFSTTAQFSNSLQAPTPIISKKANVSGGKQAGKRKLARRPRGTGGTSRRRGKTGKPGSKLKNKTVPAQSVQDKENQPGGANSQEDPNKHILGEGLKSSLVLFSTDDRRMKTQDMCRCCGSFGQGVEGHLIPCSQCGQCYHPYCVNVKINKVIITKGWRCLDCTFCEGCGKGSDEARLLLCDNCDISYHTYCLDPPLDHVPHGGWKCKWCVVCTLCARTTPGKSCKWMSNYTLCGPCSSLTTCPICKTLYKVDDLMIQCVECERWLHAYCDQFTKEIDVERAADAGYKCYYCRPKSQSFFACIASTSSITTTSRWGQSTVNTLASMSSYAFGTFGPSSPMATSIQHYHPGSGRKPLHPVQRYGSKGTVEMSLASRIALGNTGENCSPAAVFLTECGRKHIDETKRHHNKVIKKKQKPRNRMRKTDQPGGNNAVTNAERSSSQTGRGTAPETNSGGENNTWSARQPLQAKKTASKKRDGGAATKDNQLQNLQMDFFGRSLLMSTTSNIAENIPYTHPSPAKDVTDNVKETVSQPMDSVRWSTPPALAQNVPAAVHPPVTCAPAMPAPDPIETLPTAPDLNLPDPDVLVNQLGMLVTAAEGESMRNEQDSSNQGGRLTGGSVSSGSHVTEEVHSLNPDILVPPGGDLPMVDSKDIEEFFTGIENELNQRQPGLVSDPLLSSVGVHVQSNPVPQRPPPPPYPAASRGPYLREIHSHAWDTMPVGEPPPYQTTHQDHRIHTNIDMVHTPTNGSRVEPEFEHFDDDLGPRRPRPESPRADSHKQLLKWQEDEKLGAMATISPVLYANLNYPNLREEYPEWVPRYRAMARLWRKLRTEEREPYRHRARDNRVKLKDQIKRNGTSKPGVSSSQITTEAPAAPVVNGLPIERQPEHSSNVKSERPISYPGMIAPNPHNNNTQVNIITNTEKSQVMQVVPQQPNAQYPFPSKPSFPPTEPLASISQPIQPAEPTLTSPQGAHNMANEVSKKDRTPKKNRGDRDKERELKDKKNQIWQEREREWKLLQQQRQQENRKQQLQNQDIYSVRKDVRSKPNKTADWRKPASEADNVSQITVQHGSQASAHNDSSIQRQLSNFISSTQSGGVEQALQDASVIAVPHAERVVENSQSSSSFPIETVVATTSVTSVEIQASRWRHEPSCPPGNSLPEKTSRIMSAEEQPQNWLSQRDQHQHTQHSMQQHISESQLHHHEVRYELQQPGQPEQTGFNQPTLAPQVPASTPNTPISSNNELNKPVSREASAYQSATQHLAVTRPEMSAVHSTQSEASESNRDQTPRQKQQEALQKQQQIQHLQKQQQLQQQEVLQREQRKQLVLAQKQQQEFIQMQLNQHRFPPQQPYQPPQPPRQANQFTVNTKEMPEIDTEEEHQERLQYLYRQRQMQKQLQARQYMVQQQTPTPQNMWGNNAQVMPGVPPAIASDPIQQRLFLEQQRTSQRHDLQLVSMDKSNHPQHISNPFNQQPLPAAIVDHTPKFNFHELAKNGQNDSEFLTATQASHSQASISTYSTQTLATSHASTTAIYSDIASAKSEKRKTGRKDRRSSTIDLSTHAGHFGAAGYPNAAVETEAQRDIVAVNHSGNIENEILPVSQETCVTVDEGNARRVDTADPSFAPPNDEVREHEDQGNGDEFSGKPLVLPYGTGNPSLPANPANPQPVLPPPQLALSPQQQHMLLQAQQQQLLWQQAHSQLQHQYQLLYQQLQQLQIQLQQTQDPALHQRVLQQQQQLRFLQTQILQHWQQGQLVVQQIHMQVFGLNAMYNQMDPTQQKHMQLYQQELVRQQQQWAQQYGSSMGLTDIFGRNPGLPQDIRPPTNEEKPKRSRRSRSKAKNPPKESVPTSSAQNIELTLSDSGPVVQKTQATTITQGTAEITTTVATTVAQNVPESGAITKDEKQERQNEVEIQQQGLQQHGQEQTVEQQQVTQQSEKQQPTSGYLRVDQLQTQDSQGHYQGQQQQSQELQQQLAQNQSQPNQIQQLIQQQQLHQQQQQRRQQQHQEQTHQQPLAIHQQQLSQQQLAQQQPAPQQQHQSHQSQQEQQQSQHVHSENIKQLNQQPVADHMQLQHQLQHPPYELQHRSQPTTPQQPTPFPQQQENLEQQAYRTHGEISSSFNNSDVTRDHPQAVLERRPTPDGRSKMERTNSAVHDGSCRPVDSSCIPIITVNDATQHSLVGSSSTSQSRTGITSPKITSVPNDTGDKNQAPKALEKLEMMVADMDVEAKRTEAETARRAEEMQNDDFISETLTVMNISSSNESLQTLSGQKDIVAAGTYGVNILSNIHGSSKPEEMKNEFAGNNHFVEKKVPEELTLKNGSDLSSPKAVAASYTFMANAELKDIQDTTKTLDKNDTKDDSRKSLESSHEQEQQKPEIMNKEQDDLVRVKRQFESEERERKISERKKMKSLHSDRKHSKKETTRRSSKSKKARLTDEAIVQSLKELPPLQLCEPEFLMPSLIIQPTLNGLSRGQAAFRGSFGRSYIAGVDDHYANKKFPDVKACLGNPPTPPTSLPPSPTFVHNLATKEQRVYDMLAERTHNSFSNSMFPTPPYGDSGADVKNGLSKGKQVDRIHRQRYGAFEDHSQILAGTAAQNKTYPAFVIDKGLSVRSKAESSLQMDNDVNKIYSDVNVTLTISAISDKTVHETVNAISELINVDTPKTFTVQSPVRIASAVYLDNNERIRNTQFPTGPNVERVMSTALDNSEMKEDNFGPYCRHCDLVILGIGVVRNTSTEEKKDDSNDSRALDYKNVNVEDGINDDRDIFCSSACLKQYYSLDTSETCSSKGSSSSVTTPEEELKTKALATSNEFVNENDGEMKVRGDEVAEGTSSCSLGKSHQKSQNDEVEVEEKRSKKSQWRRWKETPSPKTKPNELSDDEVFQLLVKNGMATESKSSEKDRRSCVLCYQSGDGDTNGRARLLNVDLDAWVHLNCALWSHEVYETQNGALMNVEDAIKRGEKTECVVCHGKGATILCSKVVGTCLVNCSNSYHFQCARDHGCLFFKDKTVLCPKHQSDYLEENTLPSHAVFRKVFVNRQEIEQIAKMLNHNQTSEKPYSFRIGNLILNSIGQLLPHQVQAFHTRDFVYPVGFSTTRIYWSMRVVGRRCRYQCHVKDVNGDPYFVVKVEEEGYEDVSFEARTPRDAWLKILEPVESQRKNTNRVNLFPGYITGEDLFGLSETLIVRIVESMPGVDQMQGYNMRYGRSPIMELPLAINPSGCARSEPHLRTHFKRPARARRSTKNASSATTVVVPPEEFNNSVYSKQFAHSKTQQYRKLKSEWRSNVVLGRSRIQGLGLFANRDLEGNNMVIEYIGSIIRNEVANKRERIYESQNHGVYMFRIDNDSVIDATIAGGPARYINHSCQPNCVAEVVRFEREQKIIIISNRRIEKGEELTYDYKFDFEDDQHKIPCLCGAVNCRKWMN
ncbi:LOW QUALITY PROTEIN: histone-lysine N-methyltransferase 2C-like [Dendronephthya gigantea]|uniref:LOW QUALITY PROTEIN: histone-lysine N-methyltransferase 2C-like n=1 Tax=Dendronephthya gigantea TaxID=151771 RepID=UPI00106C7CF0|nr:LOW QUALITY PROTEIN: histone-lysine N-methyltransferase 2C-like [Dendronephthya gigantea]